MGEGTYPTVKNGNPYHERMLPPHFIKKQLPRIFPSPHNKEHYFRITWGGLPSYPGWRGDAVNSNVLRYTSVATVLRTMSPLSEQFGPNLKGIQIASKDSCGRPWCGLCVATTAPRNFFCNLFSLGLEAGESWPSMYGSP